MATDGTRSTPSESGREENWNEIFTDIGVDPNQPFPTDGTEELTATQGEAVVASSQEAAPADPAPQAAPTGDDGEGLVAAAPAAAPASPETPDDLANATPFEYTADGQTKTIDGTYRIAGEGLIVPEEHVARFQQMASRADSLERQNQGLYQETQQSKQRDATWNRLSSWDVQGPDGKPQTVSGERGLAEMRLAAQRGVAILNAIGPIFDDPIQASKLVMDVQGQDGQIYRVWNPEAVEMVQLKARLAAQTAERETWGRIGQLQAPPPPSVPTDADIQSAALPTVDAVVSAQKIAGLTDADKQYLASHVGRFIRPTRPTDNFAGPRIVDASFVEFVKDRAALRADATTKAQAAATTAAAAQKFNNGMQNGKKPAAPRPVTAQTPEPPRKTKASDWDKPLNDALPNLSDIKTWDEAIAALNQ